MPDSPESRIRELERLATLTKAKTDDHETDIRAFAPALVELAEMRVVVRQNTEALRALTQKMDDARKETAANRTLIRVAAIGLTGTFFTSTGAVIAAVIAGST